MALLDDSGQMAVSSVLVPTARPHPASLDALQEARIDKQAQAPLLRSAIAATPALVKPDILPPEQRPSLSDLLPDQEEVKKHYPEASVLKNSTELSGDSEMVESPSEPQVIVKEMTFPRQNVFQPAATPIVSGKRRRFLAWNMVCAAQF